MESLALVLEKVERVSLIAELYLDVNLNDNVNFDEMSDQEVAVWYNDKVIYPDKVRWNSYYYRHYSFFKDIQMIICTVLGKKMEYAGEVI